MLVIESAAAGCGIPNDSLMHCIDSFSIAYFVTSKKASHMYKSLTLPPKFASKFIPHPHFTMRFPGHVFCSSQVDGDKDDNKFLCWHMGTGRQAYHKAGHARREEKNGKSEKKKRCGFI